MSLNSVAMSSSSSSSSSDRVPSFPSDRALFPEWQVKMKAFLNAKGVLDVVLSPCPAVSRKVKVSDEEMVKWLAAANKLTDEADMLTRTANNAATRETAYGHSSSVFKRQYMRSARQPTATCCSHSAASS